MCKIESSRYSYCNNNNKLWEETNPRTFQVGPNNQIWELDTEGYWHLLGYTTPSPYAPLVFGIDWTSDVIKVKLGDNPPIPRRDE